MKRLSYLLIILSVIAFVVLVGYFLRYRAGGPATIGEPAPGGLPTIPSQPITQSPAGEEPGTPPAEVVRPGEQKFGVIAQNKALNYYIDTQNNAILVQPDGQIIKITRGEASVLSSSAVNNLRKAEFSYDGKFILVSFGVAANQEHSIFNVDTKSWAPLPPGLSSPAWSPNNHQIAYFRKNGGIKILETLNTVQAGTRPQELLRINAEDLRIFWVSPGQMILSDIGSALTNGSLWSFNTQTRQLSLFRDGVLGLDSLWSGEAEMGLVFGANRSRRGGALSLYDAAGNALANLSFLTLPSKCTFNIAAGNGTSTAQKFLYCAIPANAEIFGNAMLPDDYYKRAVFARDNFYRVNLEDGSIQEVMAGQPVDGDNLKVFGKNLFFVNRLDGRLYAISLE